MMNSEIGFGGVIGSKIEKLIYFDKSSLFIYGILYKNTKYDNIYIINYIDIF